MEWYEVTDEDLVEVDLLMRRIGKDDMNLIEIPFSTLDKGANRKGGIVLRRDYTSRDKKTGKIRRCYVEIKGDPKLGLPTPFEDEVYIAAMEITNRYGFEDITVPATKYELLKIMQRPPGDSRYLRRLEEGMERLKMVGIRSNDFWDNEKKEYMLLSFGIISNYGFYEDERRGRRGRDGEGGSPIKGFFTWDNLLFANSFMKDFIKSLDTETYFSLKLPVSKKLYRYGDKHIQKGSHSIDLFKLAFVRLGMSENQKYRSLVIESLRPGIEELSERNLMRIVIRESRTESGYKVVFLPAGKKQISVPREVGDGKEREASVLQDHGEKSLLITELKGFGVSDKAALNWVRKYGEERVKEALESLRFNLELGREIKSNGGWLRRHLEESWEQPSGVKQKKKQEEDERRLMEEQERNKRQEEMKKGYENWKREQRDNYLSNLTTAQRSGLEAEAFRITKGNYQLFLKGIGDQEIKESVYYGVELNRLIDERGSIPDFEGWLKQKGC